MTLPRLNSLLVPPTAPANAPLFQACRAAFTTIALLGGLYGCSAPSADVASNATSPVTPSAVNSDPAASVVAPPPSVAASVAATSPLPVVGEEEEEPIINVVATADSTAGFMPSEKVDLLFVVDNSLSMGDKQAVFAKAVPDLINYLTSPPCVDMNQVFTDPVDGKCASGSAFVFKPVKDIHIGVISSSLGPRGTTGTEIPAGCDDVPGQNDKAWLMGLMRDDALKAATYQQQGFLVWDPDQKATPPGEGNLQTLLDNFQAQILKVGETGCGFEAPLEAAYRFLSEPDPYESVQRVLCPGQADTEQPLCAEKVGIDQALLTQRSQFLRPDSVVVVMYLTDENDCSIKTQGQGFYVLRPPTSPLGNGTSACDTNPDDPCCYSCNGAPPSSCTVPADQNGCGTGMSHDPPESYNVRCFNEKGRFGADFLRKTDYYAAGFKNDMLADRANNPVDNPLLSPERGAEKVFVVGIIGVPWQDTATPETIDDPNDLRLLRNEDINWATFLTTDGQPALDPFNRESVDPRSGTSPISMATLGGPGTWNAVNGHEREMVLGASDLKDDDLQYGCIFQLETPRDCTTVADTSYCDCNIRTTEGSGETVDNTLNNPLCLAPATAPAGAGMYSTTQYYAKAYPSPRVLEVLKGVGDQGLVASICPRQTTDPSKPDFGYRPVIRALLLNAATQLAK